MSVTQRIKDVFSQFRARFRHGGEAMFEAAGYIASIVRSRKQGMVVAHAWYPPPSYTV